MASTCTAVAEPSRGAVKGGSRFKLGAVLARISPPPPLFTRD